VYLSELSIFIDELCGHGLHFTCVAFDLGGVLPSHDLIGLG
jgi:hypothetical protein